MQALILAGGEGTRLRPLTSTVPKPVVPLVDRPFIAFMLDWLRGHGVDDVIMSCGFLASGVRNVLGDGAAYGIRLRYVEEPRPLGTGGALKFAEPLLDERFLMLNGDVLTDLDLTAQLALHEAARRARDARAHAGRGPVRLRPRAHARRRRGDASSSRSPRPTRSTRATSRAGVYVLERSVLDLLEPDAARLDRARRLPAARRRRACTATSATATGSTSGRPSATCEGTFDILEGTVGTAVAERMRRRLPVRRARTSRTRGGSIPAALVERGCRIAAGARIGGRAVLEAGVTVGEHTTIERAVVLHGAEIGAHCTLRGCIVGGRRADRRPHARRGPGRPRRGRDDRRRQRRHQRRAHLPRRDDPGRRPAVLMAALDAAALRRGRPHGPARRRCSTSATHLRDALWRVDSAALAPVDAPRRAGRRRHGRLGGRRPARRAACSAPRPAPPARARDRLRRPGLDRAARRSCSARATRATRRRRSPPTTRPTAAGAPRHRRHDRRPARRARARRRRAGRAAARRLPAARRGRLLARHRAGGRRAVRRRAVAARRGRGRRRARRGAGRGVGPGRRRGQRGQAAGARAARHASRSSRAPG